MSGLATSQARRPARAVQLGQYLYSWRLLLWVRVTAITELDGRREFTVDGQEQPITAHLADDIDVCEP